MHFKQATLKKIRYPWVHRHLPYGDFASLCWKLSNFLLAMYRPMSHFDDTLKTIARRNGVKPFTTRQSASGYLSSIHFQSYRYHCYTTRQKSKQDMVLSALLPVPGRSRPPMKRVAWVPLAGYNGRNLKVTIRFGLMPKCGMSKGIYPQSCSHIHISS
jgi:hypothetical protein